VALCEGELAEVVYGNRCQSGIKFLSKASQELDMIADVAESIGMVASRLRGRGSK
jgi:hypothetical protein